VNCYNLRFHWVVITIKVVSGKLMNEWILDSPIGFCCIVRETLYY